MSQQASTICTPQPAKSFLKKGEGLKRFAAYKPPLPLSTNKIQRRQTFVKFRLDNHIKRDHPASFIPPEILYNESINLSTEIPKIAPPKIMHTPVRPNRQALGSLKASTFNCDNREEYLHGPDIMTNPYNRSEDCPIKSSLSKDADNPRIPEPVVKSEQNGLSAKEKNLSRKTTSIKSNSLEKMISFDGFRKPATPSPSPTALQPPVAETIKVTEHSEEKHEVKTPKSNAPRRYNLRGKRRPENAGGHEKATKSETTSKSGPKRTKRQLRAVVERHILPTERDEDAPSKDENIQTTAAITDSQIEGNIDSLLRKIEEKKTAMDEVEEIQDDSCHEEDKSSKYDEGKPSRQIGTDGSSSGILRTKITQPSDLCSPMTGSCVLALGEKIQQIESTVNELISRVKNCECCADLSISNTQPMRLIGNTTRSMAKNRKRPSANADNATPEIYSSLRNDVAQLKARIEAMSLNQ